jgi:SAM-dependent methyltransferase
VSGPIYRLKEDPYSSHSVILGWLGAGHGRRLLDVGAADGFLAERLTANGWQVTALERDPQDAARARSRCREVVVVDLDREVPVLSGPFDAAVYGDVLEHLADPLRVLRGLNRSLAPEAVVVVSVPNVAHVWVRLSLLLGRFEYGDRGILDRSHLRFFTRRSFIVLLESAGLSVRRLGATPAPLPSIVPERLHGRWLRAAQTLQVGAARCWASGFAYQFVAVCALAATERTPLAAWRDRAPARASNIASAQPSGFSPRPELDQIPSGVRSP